jgi:hypothetical protein
VLECIFWAPVIAWLFERTNRSLLVAMAIHAGAHLDNSAHIPAGDWRLRTLTLLVLAIAAALAASSLSGERGRLRAALRIFHSSGGP